MSAPPSLPDVAGAHVVLGEPAEPATGAAAHRFDIGTEESRLAWREVGTFIVRGTFEIAVHPAPGADGGLLRSFLRGPVLAFLLHRRGALVLHASAVALGQGAACFLGATRQGKSTLAAALERRGHPLIADDVSAVTFPGGPRLSPVSTELRLWPEAAGALGLTPDRLPPLHSGTTKCLLRSEAPAAPPEGWPLRRLYVLHRGARHALVPLGHAEALVELIRHSYLAPLLPHLDGASHLRQCARLAGEVPARRLVYPRRFGTLRHLTRLIEDDAAHAPGIGPPA